MTAGVQKNIFHIREEYLVLKLDESLEWENFCRQPVIIGFNMSCDKEEGLLRMFEIKGGRI